MSDENGTLELNASRENIEGAVEAAIKLGSHVAAMTGTTLDDTVVAVIQKNWNEPFLRGLILSLVERALAGQETMVAESDALELKNRLGLGIGEIITFVQTIKTVIQTVRNLLDAFRATTGG